MSRRAGVAAAVAALLATLAAAVPARAAPPPVSPPPPDALPETPADYSVPAARAIRIANRDPKVAAEARSRGVELTEGITPEAVRQWEVGYYADGEKVVLVVVDGESGEITLSLIHI